MIDNDLQIKLIPASKPQSKPEVIEVLQMVLGRAYREQIDTISISIHLRDGGYCTYDVL